MALTRERIIHAALRLLDDSGLDGVTLRRLADRLGVRAPTLYWHMKNKAELVDALGDAILAPLADHPDPENMTWQDWLLEAGSQFRAALLAHRDGARVIAAAQASTVLAAFSEQAMAVLVAQGQPLRRARLLVLLIERFTLGLVLEEQSEPRSEYSIAPDEAAERYPTITAAVTDYFSSGATLDDLYRDSIELMIHSGTDGRGNIPPA